MLRADRRASTSPAPPSTRWSPSYMLNPALRAQTLDDLAANRFGAELPPRAARAPRPEPRSAAVARRAAGRGAHRAARPPALEAELREAGLSATSSTRSRCRSSRCWRGWSWRACDRPRRCWLPWRASSGRSSPRSRRASTSSSAIRSTSARRSSSSRSCSTSWRCRATKRTRTGYSTDASVLEELRDKHEVVDLILEHRQVSKLKSTYVDALPTLVGRGGPGAHHLPAGGRRHRAPVEHRSEPPEHPDPDRARPPHPARVRGAARASCCSAPTTRSRSCASWPTSPATRA